MADNDDADVDLVVRAWATTTPCTHDAPYIQACVDCCARSVLAALADAGRLVPTEAPVDWSVRWPDGVVLDNSQFTEAGARRRAEVLGATVVYRHVGPWLPAYPPTETEIPHP